MLKISVYITSYNQEGYLGKAITSVLNQTLQPWEIIIIDDHSRDGSPEMIREFSAKYPKLIKPIFNSTNLGITQCRIKALQEVRGDWVTFVDGDDYFEPQKLEMEAGLIDGDVDVIYSNYSFVNQGEEALHKWNANNDRLPEGKILKDVVTRSFPGQILYRSELIRYGMLRQVGFHDPYLNLYEDFELRIRTAKVARYAYCDQVLSAYRQHQGGASKLPLEEHIQALEYIFQKNKLLWDSEPEKRYIDRQVNHILGKLCYQRGIQLLLQKRSKEAVTQFIRSLKLGGFTLDRRILHALFNRGKALEPVR